MFVLQLESTIFILAPFGADNAGPELFLCSLFQYASKCFLFSYLIVISYFSLLFFSPTHHPVSVCDAGEERGQSG